MNKGENTRLKYCIINARRVKVCLIIIKWYLTRYMETPVIKQGSTSIGVWLIHTDITIANGSIHLLIKYLQYNHVVLFSHFISDFGTDDHITRFKPI